MFAAISASIVARLASRAITVNCLHLNIHQHLGFSVHVTLRIGADVTIRYHSAADRCFVRCFDTHEESEAFCKELKQNPIHGLCDYELYVIHVAAATSRTQDTSLPSLSLTHSGNPSGNVGSFRVMAFSEIAVLYNLQRGCSGIGFVYKLHVDNITINKNVHFLLNHYMYNTKTNFYLLKIFSTFVPIPCSSAILWFILNGRSDVAGPMSLSVISSSTRSSPYRNHTLLHIVVE